MTGEFPHKGPVTPKMFPFDDIMIAYNMMGMIYWDDIKDLV